MPQNRKEWQQQQQQQILVILIITSIKFICTAFFMCRLLMIWCRRCYYCKIAVWFVKRVWEVKTKHWKIDVYFLSLSHTQTHTHHRLFISMITHSDCACVCENVCTSGEKAATAAMRKLAKPWRTHIHINALQMFICACVCAGEKWKISRKKKPTLR